MCFYFRSPIRRCYLSCQHINGKKKIFPIDIQSYICKLWFISFYYQSKETLTINVPCLLRPPNTYVFLKQQQAGFPELTGRLFCTPNCIKNCAVRNRLICFTSTYSLLSQWVSRSYCTPWFGVWESGITLSGPSQHFYSFPLTRIQFGRHADNSQTDLGD